MERLRAGDPEQIGPWQIINRLGSGGMGVVYMGTNGTEKEAVFASKLAAIKGLSMKGASKDAGTSG